MWKKVALLLLVILLLLILAAFAAYSTGWITVSESLTRPKAEQYSTGYKLSDSLESTAAVVCIAEKSLNESPEADKSQRQARLSAYEEHFQLLTRDYNAWVQNVSEGGFARPTKLPEQAPFLEDLKVQVCSP